MVVNIGDTVEIIKFTPSKFGVLLGVVEGRPHRDGTPSTRYTVRYTDDNGKVIIAGLLQGECVVTTNATRH